MCVNILSYFAFSGTSTTLPLCHDQQKQKQVKGDIRNHCFSFDISEFKAKCMYAFDIMVWIVVSALAEIYAKCKCMQCKSGSLCDTHFESSVF